MPDAERGVPEGPSLRLGIWKELMRKLEDPDWQFMDLLVAGVPLGVDGDMPRVESVFEEKTSWTLGIHLARRQSSRITTRPSRGTRTRSWSSSEKMKETAS